MEHVQVWKPCFTAVRTEACWEGMTTPPYPPRLSAGCPSSLIPKLLLFCETLQKGMGWTNANGALAL